MRLLFTGDIGFRDLDLDFERSEKVLQQVYPYIDAADYVIPNLEGPLADKSAHSPIKKSGPNLIFGKENIGFLKAMKADAVTLANNHIGDFSEGAVADTLTLLHSNNILTAGAGRNISDAYAACRFQKGEFSVSIISVCENECGRKYK